MIFGTDISDYQPDEALVGRDFVIINVQARSLLAKVELAHSLGLRWSLYSWVYPNDNGHALTRANGALELLAFHGLTPSFPVQAWFDQEEAGTTAQDLERNLYNAVAQGIAHGVYTYLYYLPNVRWVIDAYQSPLWLAYYPGNNDGSYWPEMSDTARQQGAVMHQFTSTNGTLDVNVVLDEAWYHAGVTPPGPSPGPAPAPSPKPKDEDMLVGDSDGTAYVPNGAFVIGAAGVRYVGDTAELAAWEASGATVVPMPGASINVLVRIPGTLGALPLPVPPDLSTLATTANVSEAANTTQQVIKDVLAKLFPLKWKRNVG